MIETIIEHQTICIWICWSSTLCTRKHLQSHVEHVLVLVFQCYLRLSVNFSCIHTLLWPTLPLCLRSHLNRTSFSFFFLTCPLCFHFYLSFLYSHSLSHSLYLSSLSSFSFSFLLCYTRSPRDKAVTTPKQTPLRVSIGLGIIDNNIQPHNINLSIGGVFCLKKRYPAF